MSDTADVAIVNNYVPVLEERTVAELKVVGELPKDLNGILYRNGPNPQFSVPGAHWFAGDGMLHALALDGGRATYRNRWVRTPKWLAEHDAGRALLAGFGAPLSDRPPVKIDGGVANTNIVSHAGHLLALEEAHLPIEIHAQTLDTIGPFDYSSAIHGPFTAHPKIDPRTSQMLFFGYAAGGVATPTMSFGSVAANGSVERFEHFEAPYASMVHDFIVTENYVLFPILPITASLNRARSGKSLYAWEPDKGTFVGLMRRDGATSEIRWFRGDACYVYHVMNAWEEEGRLVANVMQFEGGPLFPNADGSPKKHNEPGARLCRWSFDIAGSTDAFTSAYLDELSGEFPRIDDRYAGRPHRVGFIAANRPGANQTTEFKAIASYDVTSGRRTLYELPDSDATSEPVFVHRSPTSEEGDGWLLAMIWRGNEGRSDLAVFDAREIDHGPIGLVQLPCRVPHGFHGNWVGA